MIHITVLCDPFLRSVRELDSLRTAIVEAHIYGLRACAKSTPSTDSAAIAASVLFNTQFIIEKAVVSMN
jgi:hypothetical protein